MENYAQALKDYTEAIKLDPKDSAYYYNRGMTYSKIENTNQAIIDFTKAIEINTKDADAYKSRAEALE
jgi:tetratricopeptide (TPR) repeat protein